MSTSGLLFLALAIQAGAPARHATTGLVVEVHRSLKRVTVSCREIPGVREAMLLPFTVEDPGELASVATGMMIDFTVVVAGDSSHVEDIRPHPFASSDARGLEVGQLKVLDRIVATTPPEPPLEPGSSVPDFTLTDQNRRRVSLSQFSGKVVAVSFMYTTCHLPDYCFRLSNNFGLLQKRFASRLGEDLVLLTLTFDPENDQPEVLARYGATWKADPRGWRLLTGPLPEVRRACRMFGMNVWPDRGAITHDLHTAVIDREGRLVANLVGNEFSAHQLGDLVAAVMGRAAE